MDTDNSTKSLTPKPVYYYYTSQYVVKERGQYMEGFNKHFPYHYHHFNRASYNRRIYHSSMTYIVAKGFILLFNVTSSNNHNILPIL